MATTHLPQTAAPPLMLERETELATLEALLAAARDGEGRLVVVEGSAGIGKTRLLAETRKLAELGEFEVLTARGGELEGEFAFGIVRQLFEAPLAAATDGRARRNAERRGWAQLPHCSCRRRRPRPETARSPRSRCCTASTGSQPTSPREGRRCSSSTTCTGPTNRPCAGSRISPTGSTGSRSCCLPGRGHPNRPTFRPSSRRCCPTPERSRSVPASSARRPLQGWRMSASQIEPDPIFAAALQTGSGGNPLFLVALLDALWREGISPTADQASYVIELGPQAIARGIASRLARLPGEAARLLRAAATLGDRTELSLAAVLADLEPKAALSAASALVKGRPPQARESARVHPSRSSAPRSSRT